MQMSPSHFSPDATRLHARYKRMETGREVYTDQLQRYRQRDLTPSHLYRLGTKLFGSEPIRHRVIEAAHYVPRRLIPHTINLRRTWDGKPLDDVRPQKPQVLQRKHSEQNLNAVKTSDFTQAQYRQWMDERTRVRDGLDAMAISERWLCSKTRTPLENKLLAELRGKRRAAIAASAPIPTTQSEESVNVPTVSSSASTSEDISRRKSTLRQKRIISETEALVSHIQHGKQRFVTLITLHDPAGLGYISSEELENILHKMRPPICQDSLNVILKSLPPPATEDGKLVDYQPLIKGSIVKYVKEYLKSIDSFADIRQDCSATDNIQHSIQTGNDEGAKTTCTMSGERGELATAYKDEERRQFENLLEFCRERGIILNKELVEKALLLPSDHPRESCLEALTQPGLDLLSQEFTIPPREMTKTRKREDFGKKFGWAYKELKGRQKSTHIRIPKPPEQSAKSESCTKVRKARLKKVTVVPKVDCWLTFKEYQIFARNVTSRPGFNYKYHGLPDNNAFWPGALADKLRLWLPVETLADKPYSLYNIFQPVTHPKIYNPHTPHVEQRRAWPENTRGYIQFGGDNRKSYGLR